MAKPKPSKRRRPPKYKPRKDPDHVPLYERAQFWTALITAIAGIAAVGMMLSTLFKGPLGTAPRLSAATHARIEPLRET